MLVSLGDVFDHARHQGRPLDVKRSPLKMSGLRLQTAQPEWQTYQMGHEARSLIYSPLCLPTEFPPDAGPVTVPGCGVSAPPPRMSSRTRQSLSLPSHMPGKLVYSADTRMEYITGQRLDDCASVTTR